MDQAIMPLFLVLEVLLWSPQVLSSPLTQPMKCAEAARVCTSFLAFKPPENHSLGLVESMFDVLPTDITIEGSSHDYLFIKKQCSCSPSKFYATKTTYTIRSGGGFAYDIIRNAYRGLALLPNASRVAEAGAVVSVRLFCGCSNGLWNYLMSYVMMEGDSLASLASRFGASMESIENINEIQNPDNVTIGSLYYIPLNLVPGQPYPIEKALPPASASIPATLSDPLSGIDGKQKYHASAGRIVVFVCIIVASILLCAGIGFPLCLKSWKCLPWRSSSKDLLRWHSYRLGGWFVRAKAEGVKEQPVNTLSPLPRALGNNVIEVEKPLVFTYEEIQFGTDKFSESNLLGQGTYGSVYCGYLREQEVAVKRMTATKSKEFMAEMNILCKVHHANLVELIGYAASDDELFLVYEYAQNGSLKSHLHDPHSKGLASLSWVMRAQIALDAARGLEYIHEHTKTRYVHRDIKTNNILLDNSYRAKISDFGLAKLVAMPGEGDASTTKIVGTYGYVSPEYMRDGLATSKSDVYAFGVVLFEIISGKEAMMRAERRSLASTMQGVLRSSSEAARMRNMREYIDPNMVNLYPEDCLFEMAMVAKRCVDEDPMLRPDMKQNVIALSNILLSSIEWEATIAGNSQIFSGLVQGR